MRPAIEPDDLRGPLRAYPEGTWWEPFTRWVAETPRRTALVVDEEEWTFGARHEAAGRLAAQLAAKNIGRGDVVACAMGRSARAVLTILALARLGAVYLPLDVRAPAARLAEIVDDAEPAAVLSDLAEPPDLGAGRWDWLGPAEDFGRCQFSPGQRAGGPPSRDGDDPVYIVYTSGSTGRPKGVVAGNRGLVNLYGELRENYFGLATARGDTVARGGTVARVAHGVSWAFDASWNPLLWLIGGHELHLLDDETRGDPELYVHAIRHRGLSIVEVGPTMTGAMVEHGLLAADARPAALLMGGEAISAALWNRLREVPETVSINLYGPTECTVFSTACRLDEHPVPNIGRPIANTTIRLVTPDGTEAEQGAVGELWLGGAGVAHGYWHRPELTASRFVEGWYRTGDLCRLLPDGRLDFHGRLDDQVKIRGQRVEPREAEQLLLSYPEVRQAAVVVTGEPGGRRLAAYVVTEPGADGLPEVLRDRLREQLPAYLLPSSITPVHRLPLTSNGKIDRAASPTEWSRLAVSAGGSVTPPRTPAEQIVADHWRQVLGATVIDVHQDFADAGGDSLRAAQLAARLRAAGIPCQLHQVLEHPTIARLSAQISVENGVD
jgi:amino acid adenylation domain-containing protein